MRVVSWNIAFRGPEAAKRQGGLLRELAPDLMLLQEASVTIHNERKEPITELSPR